MIDRKAVLDRNSPCYEKPIMRSPLSVGNGTFCFTADFTGLQSFFDEYSAAPGSFPLCTMSEWGWHSYPKTAKEDEGLRMTGFDTYGRTVFYTTDDTGQQELFKRIRVNAHKFHLGKFSFEYEGEALKLEECKAVRQTLSLWEGILRSEFTINGINVKTVTFVHPYEDTLYFRISSPLLAERKLRVTIEFPYASHKKNAADFSAPEKHLTIPVNKRKTKTELLRILDNTIYRVNINGVNYTSSFSKKKHKITLTPVCGEMEFSARFELKKEPSLSQIGISYINPKKKPGSFNIALAICKGFWEKYWLEGAFIDFSGSKDSRASELERRLVLSQYLIAIQSRGYLPPAETGLTCNSWYGKFHLEMIFWHHAHFALWGRTKEIKRTLSYYKNILPTAKRIAASQGYKGARWPKMCDPCGNNTPSSVAVLLIWQQPHPIILAEMCCRADKDIGFLKEYLEVIIETAEFMKSFLHFNKDKKRYEIGPPYIPAQERHDPKIVLNAPYEIEYFRLGFKIADDWLLRLGKKRRYAKYAENLCSPPEKDGLYLAHENCPETFTKHPFYTDHPSMLAMYGVLNSDRIDKKKMSATLDKVFEVWDKKTFYGWDLPMMAMTACRLGRIDEMIDILLAETPKNTYLENGHNMMAGDDNLPLYLPGNGALLLAVAMMAAGFGGKKGHSFPESFKVTAEGMSPYI